MRNGVSQSGCGEEVKRDGALAHDVLERGSLAGLGPDILDGGCLDGLGRLGDASQDGLELRLGLLGESLDRLDGGDLAGLGQDGLGSRQEELTSSRCRSYGPNPSSPRYAKAQATIELFLEGDFLPQT